jgi:polysaccharide biosynthesis/export protein
MFSVPERKSPTMTRVTSPRPRAVVLVLLAAALVAADGVWARSAAQQATTPVAATVDRADVLRPGDIVRLNVWREETFSGEYMVDGSGRVVLPRLGAVEVEGVPTAELRARILEGLARYLRNPSVEVVFLRRITIHGAVTNAGLYPVDPTMTVLDALALAGGARPEGRLDRMELIRADGEVVTVPTTGVQMGELRVRSGDQLFVPEQGWFRRNSMLVATGLSATVSLIVALLIAGN